MIPPVLIKISMLSLLKTGLLAMAVCIQSTAGFQLPTRLGSLMRGQTSCSLAIGKSPLRNLMPRVQATRNLAGVNMAVTLYGNRNSRSPLVEWYLHEIGTPYTHREDRAGLPNPFGQIPALTDDGVEIFESGAILLYLADKYGGMDTPLKRSGVTKWVMWANAALDPAIFTPNIEARAPRLLEILDGLLEKQNYLVGDSFSVADVAVASYLLFVPMFHANFQMSRFPNVVQYMSRCVERPAYEKAFGPGTARARNYVRSQAAAGGDGAPKKAFGFF